MQVPERFAQRDECEPGVGHDGHVDFVVATWHRRIDVDVDDARLSGRRVAPALGGHRAGAATHEHYYIRVIDDGARLWRAAVRAHHADRLRAALVDRALAADGGGHRGSQFFRQFT